MIWVIILKFLIILVLSFLFGLERQISKKPVGFATFIFVSVGSCALGIISLEISPEDPLPLLGSIVTGIGFLGAGALIKSPDKIFGFTSAASIWIFSIIGLLIGIGEYIIGSITYLIVWVVITTDKYLELAGVGDYNRKITIETKVGVDKSKILGIFEGLNSKLVELSTSKLKDISRAKYIISIPKEEIGRISEDLLKKKWVISFNIE